MIVRVYINQASGPRWPVECELVKTNKRTLWVRLPTELGGRVIKRKMDRYLIR